MTDESDHRESSTCGDDKDESGIEQDFEPKTDAEQLVNSNTDNSVTEPKQELESPHKTPESSPAPLIPINLKSHLKRNDRIKTLNRSSKRVPNSVEQTVSSCESSPEKSPSFMPSNSNKTQISQYRAQYSRRTLAITPSARQPRRTKVPEMFGDIIIKDRFRARSQFQSPARKGILKPPNGSKLPATGAKYAMTVKKSKLVPSKGRLLLK